MDPSDELKLPKKKEGFIMAASVVVLVFINFKIVLLKKKTLIKKFWARVQVQPSGQPNVNGKSWLAKQLIHQEGVSPICAKYTN